MSLVAVYYKYALLAMHTSYFMASQKSSLSKKSERDITTSEREKCSGDVYRSIQELQEFKAKDVFHQISNALAQKLEAYVE